MVESAKAGQMGSRLKCVVDPRVGLNAAFSARNSRRLAEPALLSGEVVAGIWGLPNVGGVQETLHRERMAVGKAAGVEHARQRSHVRSCPAAGFSGRERGTS